MNWIKVAKEPMFTYVSVQIITFERNNSNKHNTLRNLTERKQPVAYLQSRMEINSRPPKINSVGGQYLVSI